MKTPKLTDLKLFICAVLCITAFQSCDVSIEHVEAVPSDEEVSPSDSVTVEESAINPVAEKVRTSPPDPSKFECMPRPYHYGLQTDNFSPGTFGEVTYVYNSTDSNAVVIDSLPFNKPVNILHKEGDHYLICNPAGQAGYVKTTDLYLHAQYSGINRSTYLFGIDAYGTDDQISCETSSLKVIKLDRKRKVVDTYADSIWGNEYEVKQIYNSALKNSEALFFINYHCYSGIGLNADHFLVDNGKLLRLTLAQSGGDGGYSDISEVYLPVRLSNGEKIVLARNGILSVDSNTGEVQTYPYPSDCGIPIEELVVLESKTQEMLYDEEKREYKLNEDGTMAVGISNLETTYYRWTGTELQKVKTIKG